jgi:hypothetical protein
MAILSFKTQIFCSIFNSMPRSGIMATITSDELIQSLASISKVVLELQTELVQIKTSLDKMDGLLVDVRDRVGVLEDSVCRMDNHIDFVENVYSTLRTPLRVIKFLSLSIPVPAFYADDTPALPDRKDTESEEEEEEEEETGEIYLGET